MHSIFLQSQTMKTSFILVFSFSFLVLQNAHGLLLFDEDNNATTTPPEGIDIPWDAVARIANFDGTSASSTAGTAVHLGHGYMLTANHVSNRSHVSFDGTTWYERDTSYTPQQVAAGVDLKIFRLLQTPLTAAVNLHSGGGELDTEGYYVGWGRGRASNDDLNQSVQDFGDDATIDKRWGTNVVQSVQTFSWSTYTQEALITVLGNNEGSYEAALNIYDSGSPYFQLFNGEYVLTGIGAAIEQQTPGSATFGLETLNLNNSNRGDRNFLVQIGPYEELILEVIPEPETYALILGLLSVLLILRRRNRIR